MITKGAVKAFFWAHGIIAFLSALLALPLWPLWEFGPHALGAPVLGYWTIASCIAFASTAGYAAVLIGGFVYALARALVNEL